MLLWLLVVLEMMCRCRLELLVMLGRWDALVGICPIYTVRVICHGHRRSPLWLLLLPRIYSSPVLRPSTWRLLSRSNTAIDLVRSMALEVVLRLLWLYPTLGA